MVVVGCASLLFFELCGHLPLFFELCGHFSTLDLTWTARTPSRLVLILLHLVHAPHIGRLCPCALEPGREPRGVLGEFTLRRRFPLALAMPARELGLV